MVVMSETSSIPADYPPYDPIEWNWDGHVQTLLSKLAPPEENLDDWPPREVKIPLGEQSDGQLLTLLHDPESSEGPLVVLLHGLGGDGDSDYVRSCAQSLLEHSMAVLRVNFRGCGGGKELCQGVHHPDRVADLKLLVDYLESAEEGRLARNGLLLVGLSLGGNQLLRYLADHETGSSVIGAVSVSAPLDLAACSRWLHELDNRGYEWYVLEKLRNQALRDGAALNDQQRERIEAAQSLWQLDESFTAPYCGYDDVEQYYRANSATSALAAVDIPTLLIYAQDDPFVPAESYDGIDEKISDSITPLIVPQGGHVGFNDQNESPWHHRCIAHFARTLSGDT